MPSILYAIPLAAVVSVVYTATRFELPAKIWQQSTLMFAKTILGLVAIYVLLWLFSR